MAHPQWTQSSASGLGETRYLARDERQQNGAGMAEVAAEEPAAAGKQLSGGGEATHLPTVHPQQAHPEFAGSTEELRPAQVVLEERDLGREVLPGSSEAAVELRRVIRQICPGCGESFPSLEEVRQHWLELHQVPTAHLPAEHPGNADIGLAAETPTVKVPTVHTQVHPDCCKASPTWGKAQEHWPQMHHQPAAPSLDAAGREVRSTDEFAAKMPTAEATTLRWQICPDCGAAFPTLEQAREHWLDVHRPSDVPLPVAQLDHADREPADANCEPVVETPVTRSSDADRELVVEMPAAGMPTLRKQICPDCHAAFSTLEEARDHWLEVHQSPAAHPSGADTGLSTETPPAAASIARAKLVESDERGQPVIVRHVDEAAGAARTIVMNEDGSQRVFGAATVSSMIGQDEGELTQWIAAMTDRHLRGLLHELRERLVEDSQRLHSRRQELERLARQLHLTYFGVPEGVSERELDNVYRRLARTMHPDKNGGTEEAKERFQAMKERYEELKSQLSEPLPTAAAGQQSAETGEEGKENREGKENCDVDGNRIEADDEEQKDGSRQGGNGGSKERNLEPCDEGTGTGEVNGDAEQLGDAEQHPGCQPQDRRALEESAWKMLRQKKMIDQNLKILESDFQRVHVEAAIGQG